MTQTEALKLALQQVEVAVEYIDHLGGESGMYRAALVGLKKAVAQEHEPVGFYDARGNDICIEIPIGESRDWWQPVYTTPPQRTWVGLTDREKSNLWLESRAAIPRFYTYATLLEAYLKEKNI